MQPLDPSAIQQFFQWVSLPFGTQPLPCAELLFKQPDLIRKCLEFVPNRLLKKVFDYVGRHKKTGEWERRLRPMLKAWYEHCKTQAF